MMHIVKYYTQNIHMKIFVFQVHFGCSKSLFGYLSGLGMGSGPKYPRAKAADYGQSRSNLRAAASGIDILTTWYYC